MNISSIIIKVLPENEDILVKELNNSKLCDVFLNENGKIVVTIEGEGIDEEISKLRQIEHIEHVMSAELVYSYSEEELEKERDKIECDITIPAWLNDENIDAKYIPYNGNLKKKF